MANLKAALLKAALHTKMENNSTQMGPQSHLILAHLCITADGTSMTALLTSIPTSRQEMYVEIELQIIELLYYLYLNAYLCLIQYKEDNADGSLATRGDWWQGMAFTAFLNNLKKMKHLRD
jgi:hypothetical protein